ncbi:MAG: ABC transporter ATP-binding protein [Acidobacteria bacterium]|nr:ABC transporter ATP-binding protein [Acidobacteriota bacterium]MCA1609800.1 ABC transporter ATP-binding protein [Acidobacteriota bacterium]
MTPPPLEVRDLKKSFGGIVALDGVSLEMPPGEILGLLGPNGAGKTTLVRSVVGRVVPDSGSLRVFGQPPEHPDAVASRGWVPQEISLYPLLTPRENLWTFGRYQGLSGAELDSAIDRSLEWSGLADRAKDRTSSLSGGMRRRLNMAAGTIHSPKLLLLDEPTVGVDPQSRERIYTMIAELKARAVSLVYTTHYMEEAERLCDRIAIIDHGRIIAAGTRDALVRSTLGVNQTVRIDADAPIAPALREKLERVGAKVDGLRVLLLADDPPKQIRDLLEAFHGENAGVADLTLKHATLEEVFLNLTGRELRE